MVEFAMTGDKGKRVTKWMILTKLNDSPAHFWFQIHKFRIDNIEYTECSTEFVSAYENAVLITILRQ